jgi:adenosylmethionine-8-amino-7-oxononanoate aminotransferase
LRALELYEEEDILERIKPLIVIIDIRMKEVAKFFKNSFYNTLGMIGMIDISDEDGGAIRAKKIADMTLNKGLFIRPLGKAIYVWPPLVINEDELNWLFDVLEKCVDC